MAAALGRVPSGLFILTAGSDGDAGGMLTSWVQQCSFDPPQVTVAVERTRTVNDLLGTGAHFVLNLLGEGQADLLKAFSKGFEASRSALSELDAGRRAGAVPVLRDALGHLTCVVVGRFPAGDHDVIVARIESGGLHRDGSPAVHVRKNGLKY